MADALLLVFFLLLCHIRQDQCFPCFRGLSFLLCSSDNGCHLESNSLVANSINAAVITHQASADLGHPAGDMDDDMVSMMLRRASELTGSGSSCLRMAEFLDLADKMQASAK